MPAPKDEKKKKKQAEIRKRKEALKKREAKKKLEEEKAKDPVKFETKKSLNKMKVIKDAGKVIKMKKRRITFVVDKKVFEDNGHEVK